MEIKSITHKLIVGGVEAYLTVGICSNQQTQFPHLQDGEICLIDLKISTGTGCGDSDMATMATLFTSIFAAANVGLSHGAKIEDYCREWIDQNFLPNGPTMTPEIPMVRSILDYVARWLNIRFKLFGVKNE